MMNPGNLTLPFAESVMIGNTLATVIRSSRRKTVELQVHGDQVVVRAPAYIPVRLLELELQKKAGWVAKKLEISRLQPGEVTRRFVSGETIPFLGRDLVLDIRRAQRSEAMLKDNVLTIFVSSRVKKREEFIRQSIIQWIRRQACSHLEQRALHYSEAIDVSWHGLRVKSFKRLWGSCSRSGELSFNWRIMMAPESVIDYVVAHELTHRIEFNHSARFWSILESIIPDYRELRNWLHHNARRLNI